MNIVNEKLILVKLLLLVRLSCEHEEGVKERGRVRSEQSERGRPEQLVSGARHKSPDSWPRTSLYSCSCVTSVWRRLACNTDRPTPGAPVVLVTSSQSSINKQK